MSSLYSLKRLSAVERIRFDSLVIEFGQEFALEKKNKKSAGSASGARRSVTQ